MMRVLPYRSRRKYIGAFDAYVSVWMYETNGIRRSCLCLRPHARHEGFDQTRNVAELWATVRRTMHKS